ncbi:YtzC family protein [Bacillus sp. JJ1566]|uniref:YtzC family protein n=1 Tax=Bacillus sp. JJ1566 TaxID=3122961 RepID=UPI002FFF149C
MATRQSVEAFLQRCEDTLRNAQEQITTARRQEAYNETEYTDAQMQLEEVTNELAKLAMSCNGQQREQLHRMRLQLQQLQNDMTLDANIIQEYKM